MTRKNAKLSLNKETLRTLSGAQLRAAIGGGDSQFVVYSQENYDYTETTYWAGPNTGTIFCDDKLNAR